MGTYKNSKGRPEPEDFWIHLTPTELDDPAFRAAAMGTIYESEAQLAAEASVPPKQNPDDPDDNLPTQVWPGL